MEGNHPARTRYRLHCGATGTGPGSGSRTGPCGEKEDPPPGSREREGIRQAGSRCYPTTLIARPAAPAAPVT
ncbi:MAG TPA: hypothetical protein PLI31_08175, partial [Methanoregulaceae archaeon]|nr:hypothetical protein [Methanoregulaceae archaeon]